MGQAESIPESNSNYTATKKTKGNETKRHKNETPKNTEQNVVGYNDTNKNASISKPAAKEQTIDETKQQQQEEQQQHMSESEEKSEDTPQNLIRLSKEEALIDRCYGCVIGAAIGDSIGSYCEFRRSAIDKTELKQAMKMPGGGTWGSRVITGQVTDDTELAVSLAYGLMKIIGRSNQMVRLKTKTKTADIDENKQNTNETSDSNNNNHHIFDLSPIAIEYKRWMDSCPFDIGICTRQTLSYAPSVKDMKQAAYNYNENSKQGNQANGAMMRCMPLCIYGYMLDNDNLYTLMKQDASLTHANTAVYLANTCYAIMIQSLLRADPCNDKRNIHAFDEMHEFLLEVTQDEKYENTDECNVAQKYFLNDWLSIFLSDKVSTSQDYDLLDVRDLHAATNSQGWIKIAFQRCCYHLLKATPYKRAMRSVVGEGGDSDTNACIVGGIMGAYWGLQGIPNKYIDNIKNCVPILDKHRDIFQAKWYFTDKIPELLLQSAPTDDSFKFVEKYE